MVLGEAFTSLGKIGGFKYGIVLGCTDGEERGVLETPDCAAAMICDLRTSEARSDNNYA